jgi:hypothetical protein
MTNSPSARGLTRLAAMLAAALAAALMVAAALAGGAHAARACAAPAYPHHDGYFTNLNVTNTSCATGRKVVLAWYDCRLQHGKSGHCTERVLGFSCTEKRITARVDGVPTQIDARVTCHSGKATVVHYYQQDLP